MNYFKNQSVEIRLTPGTDITGATVKILFERPNHTHGEWIGEVQGPEIVYTTAVGEINLPGTWKFQAYVLKAGLAKYGQIVYQDFIEPLN
jgi:hypothetical protein